MTADPDHPCPEWRLLLHGLVDNELDAEHARRVERHVAEHPACAAELVRIRRTRQVLGAGEVRWRAPDALRSRLTAAIAAEVAGTAAPLPPAGAWARIAGWLGSFLAPLQPLTLPASAAVLALSVVLVAMPRPETQNLPSELVGSHIRSMLADHLTDVPTSDRHTVKPWFNGQVPFSPPVVDLADHGFPLKGGRVDYVGGKVVAALVFQHEAHVVNLFVWPGTGQESSGARDGFNLIGWTEGGLTFWAVSDLNAPELSDFARAFREAAKKT